MSTLWTFHFNSSCKFINAEFIFEFEGERYRFIRGTEEESDKLLTIVEDDSPEGSDKCFERTLRLLDYLNWDLGGGVDYLLRQGGSFNSETITLEKAPLLGSCRRNLRSNLIHSFSRIPIVSDDAQRFALRLWNEAEISTSPFLAFLNYLSIVELPTKKGESHKSRAINWINNLSPNRIFGLAELKENIKNKYHSKYDVGHFLYDEGRNAIAHVTKPTHMRRFDRESYERISDLNRAMKAIAKHYIVNELKLGHYSKELKVLKTKKRTNALKFLSENKKWEKIVRKHTETLLRTHFKVK
jgi:hypothetical protein